MHTAWRAAQSALNEARDTLAGAEHAAKESNEALGALTEARKRTGEALDEARESEADANRLLGDLGDQEELAAELEEQRETVAAKRSAYTEARSVVDNLEREIQLRKESP